MKKSKVGGRCPHCGWKETVAYLSCEKGCKKTKDQRQFLACGCLHPGDFHCNCGNPCWSFF